MTSTTAAPGLRAGSRAGLHIRSAVPSSVTVLFLVGGLASCAGGGGAPVPTSAAAQTMFLRTSGDWVVDDQYSEPVSLALEPMREVRTAVPGPDAEAVQDFYPIGRRMSTYQSNAVGRQDRTAMREVVLMTSARPDRLELALSADEFSIRYDDGETWTLPTDGSRISVQGQLKEARLRIEWEEGGSPTLEREVEGGGVLRDNFQALSDGRLVVTRQAIFSGEVWQPTRFVYRKAR